MPRFACEDRPFFGAREQPLDAQVAIQFLPMETVVEHFHRAALLLGREQKRGNVLQGHEDDDPRIEADAQVARVDFRFKNFWRRIHMWN